MTSFLDDDLSGAELRRVDLSRSTFAHVDLTGARMRGIDLTDVHIAESDLHDVRIDAELRHVVVNGVEIDAYVDAELDRRQPGRSLMRPADADGFRLAWRHLEQRWADTVEWPAASMSPSCTSR